MNATDLSGLLDPGSVAVIGATEKPGRIGRIIFEQMLSHDGPLYPVNIREKEVLGRKAYFRIEDVPGKIDLAVIAVNAKVAVDLAESCAKCGVSHIIVVAGGFSESGPEGEILENRLKQIPKKFPTRILGPNTIGIFVPHNRIDTIFVEHGDRALAGGGGVAFISQSGSVGTESLGLASNTGFGMRAFVGLGNKCDLTEIEFLEYFGEDPKTTCLAFYTESLYNGREFLEKAGEVAFRKPVVVLKAGRTPAGACAVASHTGRLAGSDRVVSGAFRQFGVQRVYDDEELCDAAKTLANLPPTKGNRVALLTPAGGYGVMGADHVELPKQRVPLVMASFSDKTKKKIRSMAVPYASVNNPVDLTASANDRLMAEVLKVILEDPGVDIVVCTAFFSPASITNRLIPEIARCAKSSPKPVIVFTQYGPYTDRYLRRFHKRGVVGFPSIGRAVRAARFLVERAFILESLETQPCLST
jgi:acyl-CoA synthetase (NDP forming)